MKTQIVVSLNKMAEFAYAAPHRKKMIVLQHKRAALTKFAQIGYREAENWLAGYIDSQFDFNHLKNKLDNINAHYLGLLASNADSTSGDLKALYNGANALSWLSDMRSFNPPQDLQFQSCDRFSSDGLVIGRVLIKARPDGLVVKRKGRSVRVGAVKFHFPKTHPLGIEGGDLAAVALYKYLSQCSGLPGKPLPSLCYSIDVSRDSTRVAPNGHVGKYKDLVDACEQYELLWNSLP